MKEKIIELAKKGLTYKQIKKELGCALSTISYHCKKEGFVSKNIFNKIDEKLVDKIRECYKIDQNSYVVSKKLNVSKTTVLRYVKDLVNKDKFSVEEKKSNTVQQVISWRKKAKIKLVEYKGGRCEKCGYDKCVKALQFHHLDPNEKDFTIGGKSWSFERLKKEADKCIMICANCHAEIHSEIEEKLASTSAS